MAYMSRIPCVFLGMSLSVASLIARYSTVSHISTGMLSACISASFAFTLQHKCQLWQSFRIRHLTPCAPRVFSLLILCRHGHTGSATCRPCCINAATPGHHANPFTTIAGTASSVSIAAAHTAIGTGGLIGRG
jgi:hypothetical protein